MFKKGALFVLAVVTAITTMVAVQTADAPPIPYSIDVTKVAADAPPIPYSQSA